MKRGSRVPLWVLFAVLAGASGVARAETPAPPGSLVTAAPLGPGRVGMLLGGGVAVLLPFYEFSVGVGLSRRVDLVGRFESVVGLFHYPSVGVRWSPLDLGRWRLGINASTSYSFFGLATDQVNFTSTLYLTLEAALSGPVTRTTDLVFSVDNEVDLLQHRSIDGKTTTLGTFCYDATLLRAGMKTRLTSDLDGFLRARVRIPVETFRYQAMSFYVIPSLEIGGAWSF
jgi:hypothetical protein